MILVTGGAGFIGSCLLAELINLGYETLTIDNLSTGTRKNVPEETIFIEGDCSDKKLIQSLTQYSISVIIHLAGQSSGEISFEEPLRDVKSNTFSTLLLLQFAKSNGIKKFLYASSMSVYGDTTHLPVDEATVKKPKSFYAVGKLASENYMRLYASSLNCIALRFFNVYGPGQDLSNMKQGMLSIFLAQALKKQSIIVKGSLSRFRDLIYVSDVIDCILKTMKSEQSTGYEEFNVCTGQPTSVQEMINLIGEELGQNLTILEEIGTPGDQQGVYGTNVKAFKELGWSPKVDIQTGISKTVNWAKNL